MTSGMNWSGERSKIIHCFLLSNLRTVLFFSTVRLHHWQYNQEAMFHYPSDILTRKIYRNLVSITVYLGSNRSPSIDWSAAIRSRSETRKGTKAIGSTSECLTMHDLEQRGRGRLTVVVYVESSEDEHGKDVEGNIGDCQSLLSKDACTRVCWEIKDQSRYRDQRLKITNRSCHPNLKNRYGREDHESAEVPNESC